MTINVFGFRLSIWFSITKENWIQHECIILETPVRRPLSQVKVTALSLWLELLK